MLALKRIEQIQYCFVSPILKFSKAIGVANIAFIFPVFFT